jgi:type IV secretion system protein TrbL
MKRVCLHIGLVLLILLAVQAEAEAAVNIISGTYAKLENAVNSVKGSLRQTALSLFKLTLTLEVALFGIRIALKRSQLQETIGEFVFLCIFAGFIAAVLLNYEEWTAAVFEGLGKLGSVSALNPATPLRAGGALVDVILDQASYLTGIENIPAAFLLMIAAGIILIVFVFLSCFILITYMEFLILGNAGVILVGLGGSKIFKEFAVNMMRYIFSLGMKFFVLNLVINVGIQFFLQLGIDKLIQGGGSGLYGNLLMAVAAALMLAFISWTLPGSIQGLLQGSAAGGSNPISRTAGMIAAGAVDRSSRGVQGAAAGAGAGYEAYNTAGHQGTSG